MTIFRQSLFITIFSILVPVLLVAQTGNAWPLPDYYHNLEKIWTEIRNLDNKYPDLVHWEIIGTTNHDRLPIYAVKLSVHAKQQRDDVPAVLFVGQHHGEEIMGVEIVMNDIEQLVSLYGKDSAVTSILQNNEVWFVPTVNPEGYNYVSRSFYPFRRKNNTDTDYNGVLDLNTDGVDLNKGYDFNWDNDEGIEPEDYYYKGPFPASEAETIAMQNFFARERFQYAILYHSSITGNFGEHIYFPWNWDGQKSPDWTDIRDVALKFASKLPRDYTEGNYRVATGWTSPIAFARDYLYANYGTFAYDVETCGIAPDGISIIRPFKPKYDEMLTKHFAALRELFSEIKTYTFRGRILDTKGLPVAGASIIYPTRHSLYQRAIKTNESGYFFKYLKTDIPFKVNLQYDFQTDIKQHTVDDTIFSWHEPELDKATSNEGLLYHQSPTGFTFSTILPCMNITRLEMNLFDNQNWIASRSERLDNYQDREPHSFTHPVTWNIPELARLNQGEVRYSLFRKWRITYQNSQEVLIARNSRETLSWYQEASNINDYWLHPNMAIGVRYPFIDKKHNNIIVNGIRIYGTPDGTLLRLVISDDNTGQPLLEKDFKAEGEDGVVILSFNPLELPQATMISLENLSSTPWKIMTETSTYPCSHQNYVRYDEWQKAETKDFGIELLLQ